ncbi:unnamed protein product [Effrenium voratum]|uniref:Uncharacterized protein n=1 Tax=Effrenium voratum TaxID=2562239 RepID=A0AA36JJK9_9DINO|nr:unnamed protein product [Effrenium voratum]
MTVLEVGSFRPVSLKAIARANEHATSLEAECLGICPELFALPGFGMNLEFEEHQRMAMQRLLSKASRHFAQDTLREMASVAPAAPRPGFAQPFEVPWAWLEALPERLLPEPGVKWQDWPDAMDANSMPTLRAGKTDAGALLMQHFTVWDLKLQRRALEKIRSQVLQEPTENLNLQSETGVHNTLLVLRFLHDLESHLEKMNAALQASSNEISPDCDEWAALELFCRPWVLVSGGVELLRVEEFVDPCIRVMMGGSAKHAERAEHRVKVFLKAVTRVPQVLELLVQRRRKELWGEEASFDGPNPETTAALGFVNFGWYRCPF